LRGRWPFRLGYAPAEPAGPHATRDPHNAG
jgi:hypothetical protein